MTPRNEIDPNGERFLRACRQMLHSAYYDAWGAPSGLNDSDDTNGLPLGYLGLPYDQEAGNLSYARAVV